MALPEKHPLLPDRIRQLPPHFSWIDRRLVRDGHLQGLSPAAWALYFFLVTVSDKLGLSFYSDRRVTRLLSLGHDELLAARQALVAADLVAYRYPLYQVLELPCRPALELPAPPWAAGMQSLGEILRQGLPLSWHLPEERTTS